MQTKAVDGPNSMNVVVVDLGRLHHVDRAKPTTVASVTHTTLRSCSRTRGIKDRPEWDPNLAVTRHSFCCPWLCQLPDAPQSGVLRRIVPSSRLVLF